MDASPGASGDRIVEVFVVVAFAFFGCPAAFPIQHHLVSIGEGRLSAFGSDIVGEGIPNIDGIPGTEGLTCDFDRVILAPPYFHVYFTGGDRFPIPDPAYKNHCTAKAYRPGIAVVRYKPRREGMRLAVFKNEHDVIIGIGRGAAGGGQGHRHAVPDLDDTLLAHRHRSRQLLRREANCRQGCQPAQHGKDRQQQNQRPNGSLFHEILLLS